MSEVDQLEKQKADNKLAIELRDVALRLHGNHDFKKLIVDGFMLHDAARYVQLSGDPSLPAENRADALALAQASGHLKRFLSVIVTMGNVAANENKQIEEALDEARREEVTE